MRVRINHVFNVAARAYRPPDSSDEENHEKCCPSRLLKLTFLDPVSNESVIGIEDEPIPAFDRLFQECLAGSRQQCTAEPNSWLAECQLAASGCRYHCETLLLRKENVSDVHLNPQRKVSKMLDTDEKEVEARPRPVTQPVAPVSDMTRDVRPATGVRAAAAGRYEGVTREGVVAESREGIAEAAAPKANTPKANEPDKTCTAGRSTAIGWKRPSFYTKTEPAPTTSVPFMLRCDVIKRRNL